MAVNVRDLPSPDGRDPVKVRMANIIIALLNGATMHPGATLTFVFTDLGQGIDVRAINTYRDSEHNPQVLAANEMIPLMVEAAPQIILPDGVTRI
jgi:hypothetical protein